VKRALILTVVAWLLLSITVVGALVLSTNLYVYVPAQGASSPTMFAAGCAPELASNGLIAQWRCPRWRF